jgi:hypothetical protein
MSAKPILTPPAPPTPMHPRSHTRRNRRPTPEGKAGILAQMEKNSSFLHILKDQLATRRAYRDEAASKIEETKKGLDRAEIRLTTARETVCTLEKSAKVLSSLSSETGTPIWDLTDLNMAHNNLDNSLQSTSCSSDDSNSPEISIHINATEQSLRRRITVASYMQVQLEEATKNFRDAHDAVSDSHENLHYALSSHRHESIHVANISRYIEDTQVLQKDLRDRLRAIWYIPDDIWRFIFRLVITDNEGSMIQPSSVHLLTLGKVCHTWRCTLQSDKTLWSQIPMGGWRSVRRLSIPLQPMKITEVLHFVLPLQDTLHTLELRGPMVDAWILYLLGHNNVYPDRPHSSVPNIVGKMDGRHTVQDSESSIAITAPIYTDFIYF